MSTLKVKLFMVWKVITAKSAQMIYQPVPGDDVGSLGFGQGSLKDLVLFSKELKTMYDNFVNMVNEAAVDAGEVRALEELRDAVGVIEKEATNGGNS